jgi:cell division protein FtsN
MLATNPPQSAPVETPSNTSAIVSQGKGSQPESASDGAENEEASGSLEMVLGPLQIASISFVVVVLLVLGCGVAYAVGRSASKAAETPTSPAPVVSAKAPPPIVTPQVQTPHVVPAANLSGHPEQSLFGTPQKGELYIQMSAIDRGMAIVFAEGLRKLGFQSRVAPGTNDHIFRVLVGPFANSADFSKAKAALNAIGLDTFGRRYDEAEAKNKPRTVEQPSPAATISSAPSSNQ